MTSLNQAESYARQASKLTKYAAVVQISVMPEKYKAISTESSIVRALQQQRYNVKRIVVTLKDASSTLIRSYNVDVNGRTPLSTNAVQDLEPFITLL